jgi:hypothetical protein
VISLSIKDQVFEHGYEYFGSNVQFFYTPSIERTRQSSIATLTSRDFLLLFGSPGIGKKELIINLAAVFGIFVYLAPGFCDYDLHLMGRLFIGSCVSGTWLCFCDVENYHHLNLAYIYKMIRTMSILNRAGGSRVTIDSHMVEIQKNSRVLMTGTYDVLHGQKLPPALKSVLKPIAFPAPDVRLIRKSNWHH